MIVILATFEQKEGVKVQMHVPLEVYNFILSL